MNTIGAVYFTGSDIIGKLVNACGSAMESAGVKLVKHRIQGDEIVNGRFVNESLLNRLSDCDAILFASPTYMGGVAAQFKAFVDATSDLWTQQAWSGKFAAGITCGNSVNGDQSMTLQYLVTFACQHGMLWVSLDTANGYNDHGVNRLGCQMGVVSQSHDDQADGRDIATAEYLGHRLASILRNQ